VVLASKGLANGQEGVKLGEYANHLTLCSWRMWK